MPLTCKKLYVNHCQPLIDRIVARIRHWSAKLLSYAGRIQLIKSVLFAITNYCPQCFPLLKKILKNIEAICRSFLWSNGEEITRRSPVAWDDVCAPKKSGGLQIISLVDWNKACLLKLLWNLCGKADNLWMKWIHSYYIPVDQILEAPIPASCPGSSKIY